MILKVLLFIALCVQCAQVAVSISAVHAIDSIDIDHAKTSVFVDNPEARDSLITPYVGGVYVMTNGADSNSILAYGRKRNGKIQLLGEYKTGGKGTSLDDGDGVDPLISAFSLTISRNRRYIFAVNAGSASVTVFRILKSLKLERTDVQKVNGFGPVAIAQRRSLVYVASADKDGEFESVFDQRGVLSGYRLTRGGKLVAIRRSVRRLSDRPAAIKISPDGRSLVVSSVFAGSAALNTEAVRQVVSFRVFATGRLSRRPVSSVTSTKLNNAAGRNLPTSIGFDIAVSNKIQYVVVTEARGIEPDGVEVSLQTPSVSTWRLDRDGILRAVQLDVLVGTSLTEGEGATCWMEFSTNNRYFWTANTASDTISAFRFSGGKSTLVQQVAARGANPVDLWRSDDGKYLYQLLSGSVGVFEIFDAFKLRQIQNETSVPDMFAQGIVAF